jgi:hypothetical protein
MTLIERWILVGLGLGGAFALGYGARSYEKHREPPTQVAVVPPSMFMQPMPVPSSRMPAEEARPIKKEEPKIEHFRTSEVKKEYSRPLEVKKEERKLERDLTLQLPTAREIGKEPPRPAEKSLLLPDSLPLPRTVSPPLLMLPQVKAQELPCEPTFESLPPSQSREPDLLIRTVKNVKSTGEIPVDPNGMDFQLIKNVMGIKTTIMDEAKPAVDLPVLQKKSPAFPFGLLVPAAIPLQKANATPSDPFFDLE